MSKTLEYTENPYLAARREWDERNGTLVKAAHDWKMIAFLLAGSVILSIGGLIYLGSKSKFVPYVMEVDSNGKILNVSVPEPRKPDDRVVTATMAEWISNHRAVVIDAKVQREFLFKTYAYIKDPSAAKAAIDDWYGKNNPLKRVVFETASVQVESVLRLSQDSFQIEWSENRSDLNGKHLGDPERFRAILTVEFGEVDADSLMLNPLGVYIKNFSFQKIGG